MPRKLLALALPLTVLAAGCVTVNAARLVPAGTYAPVPTEEVVVFETEEDVDRPFEKVALLYAEGDVDVTNERQMINAARKKAGRLGANAIILREFREPRLSTRIAAAIFDVPAYRKARLLAIRVGDDVRADRRDDDAPIPEVAF